MQVNPISDRLMSITLNAFMPISVIVFYNYTATKDYITEQREELYTKLEKEYNRLAKKKSIYNLRF